MQPDEIKANLKQKIAEAQELSAHHKRELDKNPDNIIFRIRFNSFRTFVEDLESQLAEYENQLNEEALNSTKFQQLLKEAHDAISGLNNAIVEVQTTLQVQGKDYNNFEVQRYISKALEKELEKKKENIQGITIPIKELNSLTHVSKDNLTGFNKFTSYLKAVA